MIKGRKRPDGVALRDFTFPTLKDWATEILLF